MSRRRIRDRMTDLRRRLAEVEKQRELRRKSREKNSTPVVALVGYTNSGKSTLLNKLTGSDVYARDQLFATLDAVSKSVTDTETPFILVDTVGFIDKLPHDLVKAFRSTLEEAVNADLLLLVADYSDPGYPEQIEVTKKTLAEIGAGDIPRIVVYNKCDRREGVTYPRIRPGNDLSVPDRIYVSAKEEDSLQLLTRLVCDTVYRHFVEATFLIPYSESAAASVIMQQAHVSFTEYQERCTLLTARCPRALVEKYRRYLVD
jgi:GTP-binding protein HflX